ncbi:hypothetical protein EU537_04225 [Candidatus Thorarchaeota archaeon]|nr:MAG: hypothetical protein EU537_04225 [Candidatus Thorarchaeota archaeon]
MSGVEKPESIQREKLIITFRPKRISSLFNYISGAIFITVGLVFMIGSSAGFIAYSFIAWTFGLGAILFGSVVMIWTELKRRSTLYILTDWNVRMRTGYLSKTTRRVFYDDIDSVEVQTDAQDEIADQGKIEIYAEGESEPALSLDAVENPYGIREIVLRFKETIEQPVPWNHIEKTRIAPY